MQKPFRSERAKSSAPIRIVVVERGGRKLFRIGEVSFPRMRLHTICPPSRMNIMLEAAQYGLGATIWFRPQFLPKVLAHARGETV